MGHQIHLCLLPVVCALAIAGHPAAAAQQATEAPPPDTVPPSDASDMPSMSRRQGQVALAGGTTGLRLPRFPRAQVQLHGLPGPDSDGDGLTDEEEAWWLTDPHNPDTEGDGFSDGAEVAQLLNGDTSKRRPFKVSSLTADNDWDGDGIPNLVEINVLGTDPNNRNTDGDKYDDGMEFFGVDLQGNRMPGYVARPGRSPLVSAYPEITFLILTNSLRVERVNIVLDGTNVTHGTNVGYALSETEGQSTTVGQTTTHTVNQWQEAGNRQAESQARSSYQENFDKTTSMSFHAYREGARTEAEASQTFTTEAGLEAKVGVGVIGPYAEVGAHVTTTAELYSTQKSSLEQESLSQDRNTYELQRREGNTVEYQHVNEVSTTTGAGEETGFSTSISHTSYHETTVTHSNEILSSAEWQRATSTDTAHAADLTCTVNIQNSGTEYAEGIKDLYFNIQIGNGPSLITYPPLGAGITLPSLGPGESHAYNVGPVALTLSQVRAIDEGQPIRVWVEAFDYTDKKLKESIIQQTVLVEINDGVEDGADEVERYLLPTWGDETYMDILDRVFFPSKAANGDLAGLITPEPDGTYDDHPVTTNSWWDIFLSKSEASAISTNGEPFAVRFGDTLTLAVGRWAFVTNAYVTNGATTNIVIFTNIVETKTATFTNTTVSYGAATARQLVNVLKDPRLALGVGAMPLVVGGRTNLMLWKPITPSIGDPTIRVVGGTALAALGFDTNTHDVYSPSRFLYERAQAGTRVAMRYCRDTDGDGYTDRQELQHLTDLNNPTSHPDPLIVAGYLTTFQLIGETNGEPVYKVTLNMVFQNVGDYVATGVQAVLLSSLNDGTDIVDNFCGGAGRLDPSAHPTIIENDTMVYIARESRVWPVFCGPRILVSYASPSGQKRFVTTLYLADSTFVEAGGSCFADLSFYRSLMTTAPTIRTLGGSSIWTLDRPNQIMPVVSPAQAVILLGAKLYLQFATLDGTTVFSSTNVLDLAGTNAIEAAATFKPAWVLPESEIGTSYKCVCLLADASGSIIDTVVFEGLIAPPSPPLKLTISQKSDGQIPLRLEGEGEQVCHVEVSTNLTFWEEFSTNSLVSGSVGWEDLANAPQRFYRAYLLPAPTIMYQPQNTTVPIGANVAFSVVVETCQSARYEWDKNGVALSDDGRIAGSTSATLTIANVQPGDEGAYSVVVSTSQASAKSLRANLTVGDTAVCQETRPLCGVPVRSSFVWIPPGTFTMGSPDTEQDRQTMEGPQTVVTLTRGFWMGRYEVTQQEYKAVTGGNPSGLQGDDLPVVSVTWQGATNYCAKLTAAERTAGRLLAGYVYRLPTEAEWEYACRARTTTRFSYGDDSGYTELGNYAWYGGNSGSKIHAVGTKKPNAWGLYDMHGNVWEWCLDYWEPRHPGGNLTDPVGPDGPSSRVIRGGSWLNDRKECRSATRSSIEGGGHLGFRVVLATGQP